MNLQELVQGIKLDPAEGNIRNCPVESICCDSRKAKKNSLFVALKGKTQNGNLYIADAVAKGATIVASDTLEHQKAFPEVQFLKVERPSQFMRELSQKFYGYPSKDINVVGITGTNGKTTIAYLIESILHEAEKSCGVIGTVNYRIGERLIPAQNTTPGFLDNQKLLNDLVNDGVEYCIMEVSSHALDQNRVDMIDYRTAVFTNLTSDHLDYHLTRQNYFEAKAKLFSGLNSESLSVINADDEYGRKLFARTSSRILTYGVKRRADIMAQDIELDMSGTKFKLISPEGETVIRTNLVGDYNIYNILAAAGVCLNEGVNLDRIRKGIEYLTNVPGRLERVDCQQDFAVIIDYAHTQDALLNVLTSIRKTTSSKIILVFGCGGDRDRTKRPAMGSVASHLADFSFITSDNPRSEEPRAIIDEIIEGYEGEHYTVVVDREKAIGQALKMARKGDVVLIAGKGHEDYQIFKDRTIKFNERKIIQQFLRC